VSTKKRIPVDGQPFQWKSPFAKLNQGVPANRNTPPAVSPPPLSSSGHRKTRGRVDIIRSTAHRGGKTMTVVSGFVGISQEEKERLAKAMQKACGAGGTVKEGRIEIQGDQRETVARVLTGAGFRPVFAGG
jgi:translation initiation factor 1